MVIASKPDWNMQSLGIRQILLRGDLLDHVILRVSLLRLQLVNKRLSLILCAIFADVTIQNLDTFWIFRNVKETPLFETKLIVVRLILGQTLQGHNGIIVVLIHLNRFFWARYYRPFHDSSSSLTRPLP